MTAAHRLGELVRHPTVSVRDADGVDTGGDRDAFEGFRTALARLYPLAHETLESEVLGTGALLYRWPGRGVGAPNILMAHLDVVSADDGEWSRPPFSGEIVGTGAEERIWGRGTLDDKGSLVGILEAVERVIADGGAPESDLYLAFGNTEEIAGDGAPTIVRALRDRGVRADLVIDEGGAVVEDAFPGVSGQIAVVGVSEKGIASIRLSVEQHGGHASTPPPVTATARLAQAIVRLNARPARATLSAPTASMVRALGCTRRGVVGFALRHPRLFRAPLLAVLSRASPETAAMVRTTRAVTQLSGSEGANVMAARASATVNVRIAVDSSVSRAVEEIRRAISDDEVTIEVLFSSEPSPVSPTSGPQWDALADSIAEVFPDALVTPYVMLQASDSRFFTAISDHVYRFLPFDLTREERASIHAVDESMRVSTLERAIDFYAALIRRL